MVPTDAPLPENTETASAGLTEVLRDAPLKQEIKKKEPIKISVRLLQFRKSISDFFSIFIRLVATIIVVVFVLILIHEFSNDDLIIQPFQVPAFIEEKGYNGSVLADHILNRIAEVRRYARTQKEAQQFINSSHHKDVNIEVMGLGVSIQSVVNFIKEGLNIPVKTVSGDLIISGDLILTIQMTGQEPIVIHESVPLTGALELKNLVDKAGDQILKRSDPVILAMYNIQQNDYEMAVDASAYAINQFPKDKKWALTTYGIAQRSLGKIEEGNRKIAEALKLDPEFVIGIVALANGFANDKDYDQALTLCRRAVDLDPDFYGSYVVMSEAYLRSDKIDSALIAAEKALQLNPRDDKLVAQFATVLYYARDFDRIIEMADNWIDKDPYSKPGAFFYEVASFAELQKGNTNRALAYALMANRLAPDRFRGHECLGSTYAFMGQFGAAQKEADWAYAKRKTYMGSFKLRAEIYALMKNEKDFYSNLEQAVDRGYLLFLVADNKPFNAFARQERFKQLVVKSRNN